MTPSKAQLRAIHVLKRQAFETCQPGKPLDDWYRSELFMLVGVRSAKDLASQSEVERACAHFELLADNGETLWQERAATGPQRRMLHRVLEMAQRSEQGIAYVVGIAQNMGLMRDGDDIHDLPAKALHKVAIAMEKHGDRQAAKVEGGEDFAELLAGDPDAVVESEAVVS